MIKILSVKKMGIVANMDPFLIDRIAAAKKIFVKTQVKRLSQPYWSSDIVLLSKRNTSL